MNPSTLALGWGILVLVGGWLVRPAARRPESRSRQSTANRAGVLERLGRWLLARWVTVAPHQYRAAGAVVLTLVLGVPILGVTSATVVALLVGAAPLLVHRRRERLDTLRLTGELPETIDLLRVGIDAGLTIAHALDAVIAHSKGALAHELRRVRQEQAAGLSLDQALDRLVMRTHPQVEPLARALLSANQFGTSTSAALAQLAGDARTQQKRRAEEIARKVPVKMLFPLITCTLPAFGLLTIAPLLVTSLQSIRP